MFIYKVNKLIHFLFIGRKKSYQNQQQKKQINQDQYECYKLKDEKHSSTSTSSPIDNNTSDYEMKESSSTSSSSSPTTSKQFNNNNSSNLIDSAYVSLDAIHTAPLTNQTTSATATTSINNNKFHSILKKSITDDAIYQNQILNYKPLYKTTSSSSTSSSSSSSFDTSLERMYTDNIEYNSHNKTIMNSSQTTIISINSTINDIDYCLIDNLNISKTSSNHKDDTPLSSQVHHPSATLTFNPNIDINLQCEQIKKTHRLITLQIDSLFKFARFNLKIEAPISLSMIQTLYNLKFTSITNESNASLRRLQQKSNLTKFITKTKQKFHSLNDPQSNMPSVIERDNIIHSFNLKIIEIQSKIIKSINEIETQLLKANEFNNKHQHQQDKHKHRSKSRIKSQLITKSENHLNNKTSCFETNNISYSTELDIEWRIRHKLHKDTKYHNKKKRRGSVKPFNGNLTTFDNKTTSLFDISNAQRNRNPNTTETMI
jgi:hypothetical protein